MLYYSTNKINACTNMHSRSTNDWPYFWPHSIFLIIVCPQPSHPFQPLFKGVHKQLTPFSISTLARVWLACPQGCRRFLKLGMEGFVHKRNDCVHERSTNDGYHIHPQTPRGANEDMWCTFEPTKSTYVHSNWLFCFHSFIMGHH